MTKMTQKERKIKSNSLFKSSKYFKIFLQRKYSGPKVLQTSSRKRSFQSHRNSSKR